jgi:hypothetical protein
MSAALSRATREAAVAAAKAKGCIVVEPKDNELFVDIDNEADRLWFDGKIERIKSRTPCTWVVTSSPGGEEHQVHIVVTFASRTFTPLERIAYQAVLGSDRHRELNSVCDVLDGDPLPTIFFEKVILWNGIPMVEGRCTGESICLACERLGRHLEPDAAGGHRSRGARRRDRRYGVSVLSVDINALRALLVAAHERKPVDRRGPYVHEGGRDFRCGKQGDKSGAYTAEDAALIVAAVNALPELLDAAEHWLDDAAPCVHELENDALARRVAELEGALIWCSGSPDFNEGGQARAAWLKLCAPLLAASQAPRKSGET